MHPEINFYQTQLNAALARTGDSELWAKTLLSALVASRMSDPLLEEFWPLFPELRKAPQPQPRLRLVGGAR